MKYLVLKPLVVDGAELKSGDVIDASGWRNRDALVALRYLAIAPEVSETKPAAPKKAAAPRKTSSTK